MILLTGSSGLIGSYFYKKYKKNIIISLDNNEKHLRNGFQINKDLFKKLI